jgi:aryl-alcohol dehydrogenase-like predicted oxidoreductase
MEKRRLGTGGLTVSAAGLGTMGMSGNPGGAGMYGVADERQDIVPIPGTKRRQYLEENAGVARIK